MMTRYHAKIALPYAAKSKRQRGAFTIVEMIIVIFIFTVGAALIFGLSKAVEDDAAKSETRNTMKVLMESINAYHEHFNVFPDVSDASEQEKFPRLLKLLDAYRNSQKKLSELIPRAVSAKENRILDGWANPLRYDSDGAFVGNSQANGPVIISAGADGKFDTREDNIRSDTPEIR